MKESTKTLIVIVALAVAVFNVIYACSLNEQKASDIARIEHLENRIELLKEHCDDLTLLINRVNAVEATQQHQQEALDIIDWATKHRY